VADISFSSELVVGGYGLVDGTLPVFTSDAWEDHVQAWIDAEALVTDQRWRQAAVCASLAIHFGEQSVEKFAESVAVHPRRVYEYRAVYQLASQFRERPPNLQFSHFVVASSADDPVAVLEAAAENGLSVRQVKRLINDRQAPPLSTALPAISDDPHVATAWQAFRDACHRLAQVAPITAPATNYALEEVQYALEIPAQSVADRIIYAISEAGLTELDPIAQMLGEHRDRVRVWLSRMVEAGQLTVRRQEIDERAPGARGPARTYYGIP
jgi:hypothetical protein